MDGEKMRLQEEYIARINRVQDYIEAHLDETFSVERLAQIAYFSPYHFHRIFGSLVGETLFEYIQRLRIEKAAYLLTTQPKEPVMQIALACGFGGQAAFAKAFKKYWHMSATQFRAKYSLYHELGKDCKVNLLKSNEGEVSFEQLCYNNSTIHHQKSKAQCLKELPFSVEVKVVPTRHIVYLRHTGAYKEDVLLFDSLFETLFSWVRARLSEDLCKNLETLTICHDNPSLTEENKLRISAGIIVPTPLKGEGAVGSLTLLGGKYAIGHFELADDEYADAWALMYGRWLPKSGYQPDDGMGFEYYPNDAEKSLKGEKQEACRKSVDIYIPVKPL